ncbi:MAG: hypothetical protein ABUK01_07300 [Leptospirales bacterium]
MKVLTKTSKHQADLVSENDGYRLDFEADENRMGILYAIAAVIYVRDWTIIEGKASITSGRVKDSFYLKSLDEGLSGFIKKFYILGDLKDVLDEEYSVAEYLSRFPEKLAQLKKGREGFPLRYQIREDQDGEFLVIDIVASDRPGLLLDIVRSFYYLYFDIHSMESRTIGTEAIDTFYVSRSKGELGEFDRDIIREILKKI